MSTKVFTDIIKDRLHIGLKDFMIGKTVTILNKEFYIYDFDDFTRRFYKSVSIDILYI